MVCNFTYGEKPWCDINDDDCVGDKCIFVKILNNQKELLKRTARTLPEMIGED